MKVKIISGYYGYHTKFGVKAIGPKDDPIDLPDDEAEALIGSGIAVYVPDAFVATAPESDENAHAGENTDDEVNGADAENESREIPQFSTDMKATELRAIAKTEGIIFAVGSSKEDMVDTLTEHFYGGDAPELAAEAPIVE